MFDQQQDESQHQEEATRHSNLDLSSLSSELRPYADIVQAQELEATFPQHAPAPLNPAFHRDVRDALFDAMPENSLMIIGGETEAGELFRQNPDLYYATGFEAPDAFCLLRKTEEGQVATLLVTERDAQKTLWDGEVPTAADAIALYGLDEAIALQDSSLTEALSSALAGIETVYAAAPSSKHEETAHPVAQAIAKALEDNDYAGTSDDASEILHTQRLVKKPYEVALLMRAAKVTAKAHRDTMRTRGLSSRERRSGAVPNEGQIQADLERGFRRFGAVRPSFTTIVGADKNACILHYITNTDQCQGDSLVLVDGGAEYSGYAGDVTRTWPVSGRFSPAQKEIYQIVLDAQKKAIEAIAPGVTQGQIHQIAFEEMKSQLLEKGILPEEHADDMKKLFPHGTGHVIGLDVHDVFGSQNSRDIPLQPGMLITIEPGLYIPKALADSLGIDSRYADIGVRIEDDVLVGPDGPHVLTTDVPKEVADIERLMA